MYVITGDAAQEYQTLMTDQSREAKILEDRIKEDQKALGKIKTAVKALLLDLGGTAERTVFPTKTGNAWDRRVSGLDEALDVGLLEAHLGRKRFRAELCNRTVTHTFSLDRLELARRKGDVTDADLQAATAKGDPSYSLYHSSTESIVK